MAYNDILKLRIHGRIHGGECLNVMHFVDDTGGLGDNAQNLANDFMTNMRTTLLARACGEYFAEFIEVIKIVPFGEGPRIANFAANSIGTATGTCYTATLAEVITIHTDQVGRRKRGRIFMGGGPGTGMLAGNWIGVQTTRTQNFANALMARYGPSAPLTAWRLGVWSKATAGPDPPWSTDAFTRATSLTVRQTVRNQRRRQLGVGR